MKKQPSELPQLHPTQQKLFKLLTDENQNQSLSLRDMASLINVNSPNTVEHHLQQLEKKGYIFRDKNSGVIETLKNPVADIMYLNLYGTAQCGPEGFFAESNILERVPLPTKQLQIKPDSFLVKAANDSMEPMIHDGDLVVIERNKEPKNGSIVVVTHNDGAKIKKLYIQNNTMVLQSLNHKYNDIQVSNSDEAHIAGVVRSVFRNKMDRTIT